MRLAIPMQFSKTTKRKTVYATGDGPCSDDERIHAH